MPELNKVNVVEIMRARFLLVGGRGNKQRADPAVPGWVGGISTNSCVICLYAFKIYLDR